MSQPRVTDFFSHRKTAVGGQTKEQRSGASVRRGSSQTSSHVGGSRTRHADNKHASLCSSSVREEFVRVIDEALRLQDGESTAVKEAPSGPRTPKRSSADAEFNLGAAVFSATADHSTAKKRRHGVEAGRKAAGNVPEKGTNKSARKKLVLPAETPQVTVQLVPSEATRQPSAPADPVTRHTEDHINQPNRTARSPGEPGRKALSKEDIAALKSRLQKIKKHAEENGACSSASVSSSSSSSASVSSSSSSSASVSSSSSSSASVSSSSSSSASVSSSSSSSASVSSSSSSSGPTLPSTTNPLPKTSPSPVCDLKALKSSLARSRELAANAQRRKEKEKKEEEEERGARGDTPAPDSADQPAYQRYHALAEAAPPGLSLPFSYRLLAEMFRSMDTVVAMLHNRCETATFAKIKHGVQDMMHKRFEETHIGQIATVFPDAYTLRRERNVPTFSSSIKRSSYQLTVEPVIQSDQSEARHVLSASCLLQRRNVFHLNLVSRVKQHHQVFLSSLVPPVSVPEDRLTRWHPRFNVDTVAAVPPSSLPAAPQTERAATAREVLDKARSFITPKMEKALVSLALKTEEAAESNEPTVLQTSVVPAAPVSAALRGVSQSLLDRIRAKETQKLQAAMTRNSAQEDRLLMMSRLGELARILRNVFVAEKKPALIMEVVCNRMVASYRSALSIGEMEKHVRLLAEVAANWLTIHPIRKDFYLKLNKSTELSIVLDKLSIRLKEEERL
ncbi:DNA replication factor Cdt1 [Embiotoca jacksoni]|uniref:DNA replication factor Cdt1 n=1 Tax=Embiotoca jacksoni TaxID=100190 RepID=UPI003704A1D0